MVLHFLVTLFYFIFGFSNNSFFLKTPCCLEIFMDHTHTPNKLFEENRGPTYAKIGGKIYVHYLLYNPSIVSIKNKCFKIHIYLRLSICYTSVDYVPTTSRFLTHKSLDSLLWLSDYLMI